MKYTTFIILFWGPIYAKLAYTMAVTEKSDAYNFRIVTLEILIGRHSKELLTALLSSSS